MQPRTMRQIVAAISAFLATGFAVFVGMILMVLNFTHHETVATLLGALIAFAIALAAASVELIVAALLLVQALEARKVQN